MKVSISLRSALSVASVVFLLGSCRSPVSSAGGHGSVSFSLTIPASVSAAYPDAVKKALANARFINPETRSVEATITASDIPTTLMASASVAEGQTSASLSFPEVPVGSDRLVTVSLYDAAGILLAQGSASIAVEDGQTASTALSMVPITAKTVVPGPYSSGVRGTDVGAADAGKTRVYAFALPKAGAYTLSYSDEDIAQFPLLYDPRGTPVTTNTESLTFHSFTAAEVGTYYVVLTLPADYTFDATLELDADARLTLACPSFYVDSTLEVMDRQRQFSFSPASGLDTAKAYDVTFTGFTLVNAVSKSVTASSITVTPQATSIPPISAAPTAVVSFYDSLLGFSRSVNVTLPVPRTVYYLNSAGSKPNDSLSIGLTTLNGVSAWTNSDGAPAATAPVIAVAKDYATTEDSRIAFNYPVIALGGCDESTWTRAAAHGASTVNLHYDSGYSMLTVGSGAAGTRFVGLNLVHPASLTLDNNTLAIVSIGGKTSLRDCVVSIGPLTLNASSIDTSLYIVSVAAELELDRCSILNGPISLNATVKNCAAYSVYCNTVQPLTIVNSVVALGTITPTGSNQIYSYGIFAYQLSSVVNIAGSTISSGTLGGGSFGGSYSPTTIDFPNGGTLKLNNSLLVCGACTMGSGSVVYGPDGTGAGSIFKNNMAAYDINPGSSNIAYVGGTSYPTGNWPTLGTENKYSDSGYLGVLSFDSTNASFARPGTGSIPNLKNGGIPLTTAVAGFTPSGTDSAFLVDRDGNPRTAPWSIGAYEGD